MESLVYARYVDISHLFTEANNKYYVCCDLFEDWFVIVNQSSATSRMEIYRFSKNEPKTFPTLEKLQRYHRESFIVQPWNEFEDFNKANLIQKLNPIS